jgi:hypothetical protein
MRVRVSLFAVLYDLVLYVLVACGGARKTRLR